MELLHATAATLTLALLTGCASAPPVAPAAVADAPLIGLITKTATNPFFVQMQEGARSAARHHGAQLMIAAGQNETDHEAQVLAIDKMVAKGARTILITPADARAIVSSIRQARAAGLMVIALDSPTDPAEASDALIASNHYRMGMLAGEYARAALAGQNAVIATLDLFPGHPLGVQRHNGFMRGFGLNAADERSNEQSTAPEIVCSVDTYGERSRGQAAMADCLNRHPTINLVYTMNEPVAAGAAQALRATGKAGSVVLVSFDGSCRGNDDVRSGAITATVAQYPQQMAALGVDAGVTFARTGRRATGFLEADIALITSKPLPGVVSRDTTSHAPACWGR